MKALDTIKSTKFEAGIQYLSVYVFSFRKTRFALVIKINKYRNCPTVCDPAKLEM